MNSVECIEGLSESEACNTHLRPEANLVQGRDPRKAYPNPQKPK